MRQELITNRLVPKYFQIGVYLPLLLSFFNIHAQSTSCTSEFIFSHDPKLFNYCTFETQETQPGTMYLWDFGDGNIENSNQRITSHTFAENKVYTVCLTVTLPNFNHCNTVCKQVDMQPPACKAAFNFEVEKNTISIKNTSVGLTTGTTLKWDFGDGHVDTATAWEGDFSHTYQNRGNYFVCLTIKDDIFKCESSFCDSVTINEMDCSSDFYFNKNLTEPKNPLAYEFFIYYYYSHPRHFIYALDFGDGTKIENIRYPYPFVIPHIYSTGGLYKTCLTSWDSVNNCTSTIFKSLSVTTCIANYTYTVDVSNTYHFLATANSSTNKYSWYFNDGVNSATSDVPNPSFTCAPGKMLSVYFLLASVSDTNCHDTLYSYIMTPNSIKQYENQLITLENYPNPFSTSTTIQYGIQANSQVEITVFDLLGNKLEIIENGSKAAGEYKKEWNTGLAKGMYLLQMKVNNQLLTKKIIIDN